VICLPSMNRPPPGPFRVAEEDSVLKQETRYRVTGSLFLLALAVILLPMLFDGAGLPTRELEPVQQIPVADFEVPEPVAPAPELISRTETLRAQVDDDGFQAQTDTRIGEPVLSEVSAATEAWAIQVASFADVDNARVFRDRLRAEGYEAFLSTVKTGTDVRTRVAVGPLQNRQQAATLQAELSTRYRVNARLMAFSS